MSDVAYAEEPLVETVDENRWEWWAQVVGPFIVATCAALAYANSFQVPFVFDGVNYLQDGEHVRQLWPLDKLLEFAQTRPVGYFTFALNYAVAGYDLPSWHLTNLAIHVVGACALMGIVRRTLLTPRLVERFGDVTARLALAVAVVWVVHPLNTQSVTYLYQRLESLMGMFYLLSLYCFVRYATGGWGRFGWAAASLVSCLLATATKEVAVTLPVMVLWYDRAFLATSWKDLLARRGVFHLLLFACLALPMVMIGKTLDEYPSAGILDTTRMTPWQYARTQSVVVLHYLRLSVVPWPLNIDYAWRVENDWGHYIPALIGITELLVATGIAIWKRPAIGFLCGWWFVILAPTSSVAPIIDLAFEHRTYLSLIAVVALVVIGGYALIERFAKSSTGPVSASTAFAWGFALLLVVVAVLILLTLRRNHDYRSRMALWADVAQKAPHNPRAHYNHGVYLQTEGTNETIDQAIEEYHATLRLDPAYAAAYLNLGNLAAWRNQLDPAIDYFRQGLRYGPSDVSMMWGLADALERRGDREEALQTVDRLLQIDPTHADGLKLRERLSPTPSASGTTPAPTPTN